MALLWIAEEPVIFVHPDGSREVGRIAVGVPVQIDRDEAHCSVALDGVQTMPGPIVGASALQALLLAVRFLGMRLHDFVSRGGRVVHMDVDDEVNLQSVFGPLLREH